MNNDWIEYRNRTWILESWATGINIYMQTLKAAGLPAPSFEWQEEYHYNEDEPNKSDLTVRIRLLGHSDPE